MSKGKNTKLFDIRVVEVTDKETGKTVKKAKLQLAKGVQFTVDGVPFSLGEYNSIFLKTRAEVEEGLDNAVAKFGLDADFAQSQKEFMEEKKISSIGEVYKKN